MATSPRSGITWYAQDTLGEVVFYSPPAVGDDSTQDGEYGELESTKAVSALIVAAVRRGGRGERGAGGLETTINDDPYGEGWLIKVRLQRPLRARQPDGRRAYQAFVDAL